MNRCRRKRLRVAVIGSLLTSFISPFSSPASDRITRSEILAAMKKASVFMMDAVSTRGGFVWIYRADLTERWGEIPARPSQIWVQPPGTTSMGKLMLDLYEATGDADYLRFAERIAGALIYGQHPLGGWHYFIDFDPQGIREYYKTVASDCWGWEEYYHYDGNCTFDDDVHASATRFLMDLYLKTLDPKYRGPLDRAMNFVLTSQFPNGAWPQRFPLKDDYTSFYTFNDGVISGNIDLLLEAAAKLGHPDYEAAARRGMDFVLLSQMPPPQAGWALQYDHEMRPAKARNFEPAGLTPSQTIENISDLMRFYKITGNRNFLRGIPDALSWLDNSVLNGGQGVSYEGKFYTHATFYEVGTNRPLYPHRRKSRAELDPNDPGKGYWVDSEFGNFTGHYGEASMLDLGPIKKEFARVSALTPEEARAEYEAEKTGGRRQEDVSPEAVREIIRSLDSRGAWIETAVIPYYPDFRDRSRARKIEAIRTATFERNMRQLMAFLVSSSDVPKPAKSSNQYPRSR